MFEIVDRNKQKITYFFVISLIGTILLLLALSFKNDDKVLTKTRDLPSINVEIDSIKEFLLSQIQSPFTNINYEIQKGDTIQKILKKYQIDNREIYNIDELIDNFEINRIKSSGAVFDVKKLIWFNQHYIKTSDPDKLQALVENTLSNDWEIKLPMLNLVKDSVDNILDFERELTPFFIYKPLEINDDDTLFSNEVYQFLHLLLNELIDIPTIKVDDFKTLVNRIKNEAQFSGNIWKPIRISVTGKTNGPDISKFIEIIGSSQCYDRIKSFLELNEN